MVNETSEGEKQGALKVMFVSFLFPPYGGMAPLRSAYFAQFLAQAGWKVRVLTIKPSPRYPWRDDSLTQKISDDYSVHRVSPGVCHGWKCRLTKWIQSEHKGRVPIKVRKYVGIVSRLLSPLSAIEWMIHGIAGACRLVEKDRVDVLYCHGDPFTSNLVGRYVKYKYGIPWVMYMSDPLSFGSGVQLRGEWRQGIDRWIEGKCLEEADAVIVNCEQTQRGLEELFSRLDVSKCHIITDGYDPGPYAAAIARRPAGKFRLLYTGTMYQGAREPYHVIDAVQRLGRNDIECLFVGGIDGTYRNYVEKIGATGIVTFLPHQPHDEVIALQKGADVLLLLGWQGGYQVPGKFFEYVAAQRPIIAITNGRDAAAEYVVRLNRGCTVNNSSKDIEDVIRYHYTLWRRGALGSAYSLQECNDYSWSNLAVKLAEVLRKAHSKERGSACS